MGLSSEVEGRYSLDEMAGAAWLFGFFKGRFEGSFNVKIGGGGLGFRASVSIPETPQAPETPWKLREPSRVAKQAGRSFQSSRRLQAHKEQFFCYVGM